MVLCNLLENACTLDTTESEKGERQMKFRELPEGLYQITDVNNFNNMVFVQSFENPDNIPLSIIFPQPIEVVHDGRSYNDKGYFFPKNLDTMDADYKTFDQVRKERKSRNASYGQVKRRLMENKPLTGKTLEIALDLAGDGNTGDKYLDPIAKKLMAGQPLTDYEIHIMVDVRLLHAQLA